jgi:hypothetical protein
VKTIHVILQKVCFEFEQEFLKLQRIIKGCFYAQIMLTSKFSHIFNIRFAQRFKRLSRYQSTKSKDLIVVDVNEKSGISTVSLNRLPGNSLNLDLLSSLNDVLLGLKKDHSRGMILTSVRSCQPTKLSPSNDMKTNLFTDRKDHFLSWYRRGRVVQA